MQIYEYTPGFIHAKNFVVDDRFAVVGTVNLDYRSLFLHFEDGVVKRGVSVGLDVSCPGPHRGGWGTEEIKILVPISDIVPHGEEHYGHGPDGIATSTALCNVAKSGVDVRIITPHIPDKRYVFEVTLFFLTSFFDMPRYMVTSAGQKHAGYCGRAGEGYSGA